MMIFPATNPYVRNREIKAKFLGLDMVGQEVIFPTLTAEGRAYNTRATVVVVSVDRILPGRTWVNVEFNGAVSMVSVADDSLVYRAN